MLLFATAIIAAAPAVTVPGNAPEASL